MRHFLLADRTSEKLMEAKVSQFLTKNGKVKDFGSE